MTTNATETPWGVPSEQVTPKRSPRPGALMILALIVSAWATKGCGHRPPDVIVVETAEIQALPDGAYRVTSGWMAARLRYEQALKARLERCEAD